MGAIPPNRKIYFLVTRNTWCYGLFFCAEKELQIVFYGADPRNAKVFHQNFRHIRAEECRNGRSEMDIFCPKI